MTHHASELWWVRYVWYQVGTTYGEKCPPVYQLAAGPSASNWK